MQEEWKPNENISPARVEKISQDIVSFFLKNKEVGDSFRKMICIACPELKIFINDDKKLSENYALMIAHRIPGFLFSDDEEKSDFLLAQMLQETKLPDEDFVKWLETIIKNKSMGMDFVIKNSISPN